MKDEILYQQSFEKYKIAAEFIPKDYYVYYNWGNAISHLAKLNGSETLYRESFEKYKKVIEMNPYDSSAYKNWTIALIDLLKLTDDKAMYSEVLDIALKANKIGDGVYNLSCVYSLIGDEENALKYLKIAIDSNKIGVSHVLEDSEWKDYLDNPDFKKITLKSIVKT